MTIPLRVPFAVLLLAALPSLAVAQAVSLENLLKLEASPVPDGAPPAMVEIDPAGLAQHAFFLASEELGGRHTGTPGQREAAAYIAARFEALGLAPLGDATEAGARSYLQTYEVRRTFLEPDGTRIVLGEEAYDDGFGVLTGSRERGVDLTGRLVFCGKGGRKDFREFEDGEIPVVLLKRRRAAAAGVPPEIQFMMGFREIRVAAGIVDRAARLGAKTVLLLDLDSKLADVMQYGGVLPGKPMLAYGSELGMGAMLSGAAPRAPMVVVGRTLAEKVLAHLNLVIAEDGGVAYTEPPAAASATVQIEVRREARYECHNVVAVLEGADPALKREAVVFSAHMDHMGTRLDGETFNGADDNASGSAGLLEVAEAFAKGERPRRSVVFLSVSGEELGLWGSEHFSEHPTWPIADIVANVNIDMIGRATELSGEDEISVTPSYRHPMFSTIVQGSAALASAFELGLTNGDTFYERSDHYNFAKKGIPVVFFCDGEHEDYHQITDTPDKLDYGKMERVTRLAFWSGWEVCQADGRPEVLGRQTGWEAGSTPASQPSRR